MKKSLAVLVLSLFLPVAFATAFQWWHPKDEFGDYTDTEILQIYELGSYKRDSGSEDAKFFIEILDKENCYLIVTSMYDYQFSFYSGSASIKDENGTIWKGPRSSSSYTSYNYINLGKYDAYWTSDNSMTTLKSLFENNKILKLAFSSDYSSGNVTLDLQDYVDTYYKTNIKKANEANYSTLDKALDKIAEVAAQAHALEQSQALENEEKEPKEKEEIQEPLSNTNATTSNQVMENDNSQPIDNEETVPIELNESKSFETEQSNFTDSNAFEKNNIPTNSEPSSEEQLQNNSLLLGDNGTLVQPNLDYTQAQQEEPKTETKLQSSSSLQISIGFEMNESQDATSSTLMNCLLSLKNSYQLFNFFFTDFSIDASMGQIGTELGLSVSIGAGLKYFQMGVNFPFRYVFNDSKIAVLQPQIILQGFIPLKKGGIAIGFFAAMGEQNLLNRGTLFFGYSIKTRKGSFGKWNYE